MISRRAFALGLAGCLAGGGSAIAQAAPGARPNTGPDTLAAPPPAAPPPGGSKGRDLPYVPFEQIPNHRQFMRDIVIALANYGRQRDDKFLTVVRNGPELLIKGRREYDLETGRDPDGAAAGKYSPVGSVSQPYLQAVDGMLVDGLFYGRETFDQPTDPAAAAALRGAARVLRQHGRRVLTIEYCRNARHRVDAERQSRAEKTLTYIDGEADKRLDRLPGGHPAGENPAEVNGLGGARNFLPILRSDAFGSRSGWISALAATNFDLLLLDPFWHGTDPLTAADVRSLKYKNLGSRRRVLARVPVGRAELGRYYWKAEWKPGEPAWVVAHDPAAPSQMVVEYWDPQWKDIVGKFMQAVVDLGFDGVLLDGVEAYRYFEERMPLE